MKWLPLWLFAFALGARLLLIAVVGMDGLYGQDAFAYMNCAREILHIHWGEIPCGAKGESLPLGAACESIHKRA